MHVSRRPWLSSRCSVLVFRPPSCHIASHSVQRHAKSKRQTSASVYFCFRDTSYLTRPHGEQVNL
jgi:hypothetical protein